MIYYLYSLKDKYTGFTNPVVSMNDDSAKRDFAYAVNNNPGVMNFSPVDYDLYRIGTFDSQNGDIKPEKVCKFIANGREVVKDAE